jgi:hypothetical protein
VWSSRARPWTVSRACDLTVLGTFQSPPPGARAYVGVFYVNGPRLPPLSVFVPVPWPWQRSGPALAPQGMVAFKASPRIAWHLWRTTLRVLRVLAVTVACAPRARGPFDCCRARESTGDWCANMAHRRTGVCPFARNATEWVVHRSVFSGRSKTQSCSVQLDCLELWSALWLAMQLKGWCTTLRENFSLSISLSLCLSVSPSFRLSVSLYLCLSVSLSHRPSVHLPICLVKLFMTFWVSAAKRKSSFFHALTPIIINKHVLTPEAARGVHPNSK